MNMRVCVCVYVYVGVWVCVYGCVCVCVCVCDHICVVDCLTTYLLHSHTIQAVYPRLPI